MVVSDSDTTVTNLEWINPTSTFFRPFDGWKEKKNYKLLIFSSELTPIEGKSFNNIYVVPREKVRDGEVWVLNNEGILSKREVELLRYEKEKALISDGFEIPKKYQNLFKKMKILCLLTEMEFLQLIFHN